MKRMFSALVLGVVAAALSASPWAVRSGTTAAAEPITRPANLPDDYLALNTARVLGQGAVFLSESASWVILGDSQMHESHKATASWWRSSPSIDYCAQFICFPGAFSPYGYERITPAWAAYRSSSPSRGTTQTIIEAQRVNYALAPGFAPQSTFLGFSVNQDPTLSHAPLFGRPLDGWDVRAVAVARWTGLSSPLRLRISRDGLGAVTADATLPEGQWGLLEWPNSPASIKPSTSIFRASLQSPQNNATGGTVEILAAAIGRRAQDGNWGPGKVVLVPAQDGFNSRDLQFSWTDEARDLILDAAYGPGRPVYVWIHASNQLGTGQTYYTETSALISMWRDAYARFRLRHPDAGRLAFVLLAPWQTATASWMPDYWADAEWIVLENRADTCLIHLGNFFGKAVPDTVGPEYRMDAVRVHPADSEAASHFWAAVEACLLAPDVLDRRPEPMR